MEEYYLNKNTCCTKIPSRSSDYLQKSNFLSEFGTIGDKQEARDNLGITELLNELKSLIDNKIIRYGGITWDLEPTQGHTDRVLSSDTLYKILLNYSTNKDFNTKLNSLWTALLDKLSELNQKIDSINEGGIALSNKFGNSETIGISQKALTRVINDIYNRLSTCSPCMQDGFDLIITSDKDYFIEDSTDITITVYHTSGLDFDEIEVFIKDGDDLEQKLILTKLENGTYQTSVPVRIYNTTRIRAVGTILGMPKEKELYIMKKKAFYIGSGNTYWDVLNSGNFIKEWGKINQEVSVSSDGDYLYLIIDSEDDEKLLKFNKEDGKIHPWINMNGMLLPMTKYETTSNNLIIYKSDKTYKTGMYPIEIKYNNE